MKNFNIDAVLDEIFKTPDRAVIDVDYSTAITQDIIKHFKFLGSKGIPNRIRPCRSEYVWSEREKDIVMKAVEELPRKVIAIPCIVENGYVKCWEIQFEDIVNHNNKKSI